MMNHAQAKEMSAVFAAMGKFTAVTVEHHGFYELEFGQPMPEELANDGRWTVELRSVNAKAGNRSLEIVRDYTANPKLIALIAKKALGKATARDMAAYSRMAAEAECNAE